MNFHINAYNEPIIVGHWQLDGALPVAILVVYVTQQYRVSTVCLFSVFLTVFTGSSSIKQLVDVTFSSTSGGHLGCLRDATIPGEYRLFV